ncbi:hypothetical protein LPB140_00255 [Sphingorhabdus lutea]|uniref:DUF7336 domain-containing protein n=1 Tax=Sphingorhabdus lutea TaxID=1913578 RepID=A0A1L3J8V3_9SPHN|nr:hypothetical protein [Sphingorhabdus lutea]APG61533.1 hypothetical protein LPB140_00255 [Sphingorhabdus lutea]
MNLFVVDHIHYENGDEELAKRIGIFSSYQNAQNVIDRLKHQPGFIDYPNCFHILTLRVDKTHWSQGYNNVHIPE